MGKFICISLAAILLLGGPVSADVVVKHKSITEVANLMNMEIDGVDSYKGDKCAIDMNSMVTGSMMAMMGGGKPKEMINITRLDKGLIWELDPEKKKYREVTLESLKEDTQKRKSEAEKESEKSDYNWTVDVKTIDKPQKINGFDCRGIIGMATGVRKDNSSDTLYITIEQWAANNVPGASEIEQYKQAYAKATGADKMWGDNNIGQMMKEYGNQFAALTEKMSESGGYPIRTILSMVSSKTSSGGDSENEGTNAKDSMGEMGGSIGKKKGDESPQGAGGPGAGRSKTFIMTNEVLSIEQKPVEETKFEIPADFKRD